jgi:DNA/RNA-binding domain of Phe-tRNA-synthetase-like protein
MAELPQDWEVAPEPGWVEPALAEEFPGLSIASTALETVTGRSPEALKERLRTLSDRIAGAQAIQLRQKPIPWAYRVFFRHIGIDPDEQHTPIEAIAVERMRAGGFRSNGLVPDALLLGTLETGVPVLAFDADELEGRLGLRLAAEGDALEEHRPVAVGQIVIADERGPLGVLFGGEGERARVGRSTRRLALAAIQVAGVPPVSVEEALWTAADTISTADA